MTTRRKFIQQAVAAGVAYGIPHHLLARKETVSKTMISSKHPLRVGAPFSFPTTDPAAWAKKARELGNGAVYAPDISLNDRDYISAITAAVKVNGLIFAEVGRWGVNLLDADMNIRKKNLTTVSEGLALADELGACCCVTLSGSFATGWSDPHPKNVSEECFDMTVENARNIIDAVKPKHTKFAFEMMGWTLPDSPDNMLRLLKAVDRDAFGVHVDVCNLINSPDRFWNNTRLINEVFDKLGRWIVAAHAKDLRWLNAANIHFDECVIGEGAVDMATYLKRLVALDKDAPLMIEHMKSTEEYERCRAKIYEVGKKEGIDFV